jgi:hypothetical protein
MEPMTEEREIVIAAVAILFRLKGFIFDVTSSWRLGPLEIWIGFGQARQQAGANTVGGTRRDGKNDTDRPSTIIRIVTGTERDKRRRKRTR